MRSLSVLPRLVALLLFCLSVPLAAQELPGARLAGFDRHAGFAAQAAVGAALADGDEQWDDRFGHPSVRYTVYTAALAPNGDLYVGGSFTEIGGIPARNVARWDGRRWHALGEGIGGGGSGYVYALAFAPDGSLYVGGYFATAGTARANSIARWDPQAEAWSAIGAGLSNGQYTAYVYALAFVGNTLYAGGDFTSSGQTALRKFARWTGTAWEDVGGGLGRVNWDESFLPEGPSEVRALAARGTDLFIAGRFDAVAEGRANGLARLDTEAGTFHRVGGGVGSGWSYESAGSAVALAVDADRVCVGGRFDRVGLLDGANAAANNVACWDGAVWNTLGDALQRQWGADVKGLAFVGLDLVVTGTFDTAGGEQARHLARWDGAAWHEVGGGLGSDGAFVVPDGAGGFFVGGGFDAVGDNFGALRIARWHGGTWHALGQGLAYSTINAYLYAVTRSGERVYVGGGQTHAGGVPTANLSAWDGTRWHALGSGTNGTVRALATAPEGTVYAGGDFTVAGGQSANYVARWNPTTEAWSPLGSGTSGRVHALAVAPNGDLYAGGEFRTAGGVEVKYVARWDGTAWHALGTGVNWYVYALAVAPDGKVYAGGDFDEVGAVKANGVAVWNGTNWSALGAGVRRDLSGIVVPGEVYGIGFVGGDVYVTGEFSIAGSNAAAGAARWNQTVGWSALGAGLGGEDQTGYALEVVGQHVYVGGSFATAGGQAAANVALWDAGAGAWTPLGSGTTGDFGNVRALHHEAGNLYVAGRFHTAGAQPASSFSVWQTGEAGQALIAVDPPALAFGDVPVGTPADRMVSIRNDAAATAPLVGTVALPGGTPFEIVSGGGVFNVAPGGVHEVVVRFAPAAQGPASATLTIQHGGGTATVALSGTGTARGGRLVLRTFNPDQTPSTWVDGNGQFLFGTNGYGDRAKGTALTLPMGKNAVDGQVQAVRVWFSYADPMPGEATYTLRLYDGTPQTGPQGEPRFSQSYRVADAVADDDPETPPAPTVHAIEPPLRVAAGQSFFAVVDFGTYTNTRLLTLAAGERVDARVAEVWEMAADGAWANLSDAWTGGAAGWHLWIEADLGVSTSNAAEETVHRFHLVGAAPHPVRDEAVLRYTLDAPGPVTLAVYDLTGRRVTTLVEGVQEAGPHAVHFRAADLASGTYLLRLQAGGRTEARPLVVIR